MPPKAKFTKEEIVAAALTIVQKKGIEALTARELGNCLGSSARPVFTVFHNMEEVQQETIQAAKALYDRYVQKGLGEQAAFKAAGTQYIQFAIEEPKLFQLLFMTEKPADLQSFNVLSAIDSNHADILASIQRLYGVSEAVAARLYLHLWIYTHGIATLYATQVCKFSKEEVSEMLTEAFAGIFQKMKEGNTI